MAFQPLSVGDILMLSQQAWRIGRAFTKGQSSASEEFAEVEREANGLSDALKLTAETLHADESILSKADPETRGAVNAILESAAITLGDLESFVERYQVVRKRETKGGFVVEKSWSEVIVANWKTFKWTTEGGSITDLRNMLQMHTNTMNLCVQALQSRSLARLERTVLPMAESINSIHERVNGDLGDKIDYLHRIVMSIASGTLSLVARDRSLEDGNWKHNRRSGRTLEMADAAIQPRRLDAPSTRRFSRHAAHQRKASSPRDSVLSTPDVISSNPNEHDSSHVPMDREFEAGSPPTMCVGGALDDNTYYGESWYLSSSTPSPSRRKSSLPRREPATLPGFLQPVAEDDTVVGSSQHTIFQRPRDWPHEGNISPISERRSDSWRSSNSQAMLPPPVMAPSPTQRQAPATTSSILAQSAPENKLNSSPHPRTPKSIPNKAALSPALTSSIAFEKALFRNAAIICDVRGKRVEYAKYLPDEPDPRYNTEMVAAVGTSRIYVIRKRKNREHGGIRVVTSIWALSEDGEVRFQQSLPEVTETVPFCSYFQPEKVSIAEQEMRLRLHGNVWSDPIKEEIKSNWINYIFASENDAVSFQSAVFGRLLLGSFQTLKTTVIHDGFLGNFAFEERFANIEILRL